MTEPIDQATKERIEKEAKEYCIKKYGNNFLMHSFNSYLAGATVWAERLKQEKKESYKIGWRDGYDDFKINDLKEQLKQEKNRAIDSAIEKIKAKETSVGCPSGEAIKILESLKA